MPLPGTLLVATPTLEDPNFSRTVTLMLAFGVAEGALGVVLNRPNDVPVAALLRGWDELAADPDSVFVGGPVARDSIICLAQLKAAYEGTGFDGCSPVAGLSRLATLDLNQPPETMATGVDSVRLFSGYSSWGPGQLEVELATGSWLVLPTEPEDAFTADPDGLWARVLRRQGGHVAIYANAPPKLSMN